MACSQGRQTLAQEIRSVSGSYKIVDCLTGHVRFPAFAFSFRQQGSEQRGSIEDSTRLFKRGSSAGVKPLTVGDVAESLGR